MTRVLLAVMLLGWSMAPCGCREGSAGGDASRTDAFPTAEGGPTGCQDDTDLSPEDLLHDFGLDQDPTTVDTGPLQAAIDCLATKGGGTLWLRPGKTYLIRPRASTQVKTGDFAAPGEVTNNDDSNRVDLYSALVLRPANITITSSAVTPEDRPLLLASYDTSVTGTVKDRVWWAAFGMEPDTRDQVIGGFTLENVRVQADRGHDPTTLAQYPPVFLMALRRAKEITIRDCTLEGVQNGGTCTSRMNGPRIGLSDEKEVYATSFTFEANTLHCWASMGLWFVDGLKVRNNTSTTGLELVDCQAGCRNGEISGNTATCGSADACIEVNAGRDIEIHDNTLTVSPGGSLYGILVNGKVAPTDVYGDCAGKTASGSYDITLARNAVACPQDRPACHSRLQDFHGLPDHLGCSFLFSAASPSSGTWDAATLRMRACGTSADCGPEAPVCDPRARWCTKVCATTDDCGSGWCRGGYCQIPYRCSDNGACGQNHCRGGFCRIPCEPDSFTTVSDTDGVLFNACLPYGQTGDHYLEYVE